MRLPASFLLLAGLSVLANPAASAQPGRNPFVPAVAASAPATTTPKKDAAPSSPTTLKLPNTSPGPYRSPAPFIPPPPAGLQLPTLQLPPSDTAQAAEPTPPKDAATDAKVERKSDVFLTREQLQAQRAKCSVSLKSPATLQFSESGGRQVVKLTLSGGRQCVKGVAASDDWVEVSSVSENGELVLVVQENESQDERSAEVNIANTGTSLTVRIVQSASKEEFRQLKL